MPIWSRRSWAMLPTAPDLFEFVELGAEHVHRFFPVRVLRTFFARGDDDARRLVQDSHRRFHFVHVLAARAAGAGESHLEIVRRDVRPHALPRSAKWRPKPWTCARARLFGLRDALYAMYAGFMLDAS